MKTNNNRNKKIRHIFCTETLFCLILASLIFVSFSPYFLWRTFTGLTINLESIVLFAGFLILTVFASFKSRFLHLCYENVILSISLFLIVCLAFLVNGFGIDFYPARIVPLLCACLFMLLTDKTKVKTFTVFKILFTISLIPGIIYYLLEIFDINVPFAVLESPYAEKTLVYQYYRHYWFAVRIDSYYNVITPRLCGVFYEPGLVGTICAFLLISSRFSLKKITNIILIVAGIMTLSTAFFVLSIVGIVFILLTNRNINRHVRLFASVALGFVIFVLALVPSITKGSGFDLVSLLNDRMSNREAYENEFSSFLNSDSFSLLFGMGYNASMNNPNMSGSYYYTMPIYDHGFLTFALLLLWFVSVFFVVKKDKIKCTDRSIVIFTYFVVLFLSFLQRPYILTSGYILLIVGGALILKKDFSKNKNNLL